MYNCYKRHDKPWYVKKGGDKYDIINITGKFLCLILESLALPYLVEAAAKYEEAWSGD